MKIMNKRTIWFSISAVMIAISIFSLLTNGLNLGVDFTGGSFMALTFEREVTLAEVRDVLADFGMAKSGLQRDQADPATVFIRTPRLDEERRVEIIHALEERVGDIVAEDVYMVSGIISEELTRQALMALAIAAVAMLVYITFRFEFRFGLAAIVALLHDALITIGFFSVLGIEVTGAFVAGILTVIGYSINDTIVVFDRIRENVKYRKKETFAQVADKSISQTIVRSINTSLTTLLAVTALYAFGGRTIKDFSLALMVGILIGTYSSIFLASPLWVMLRERGRAAR